jgi:hypothetical protein
MDSRFIARVTLAVALGACAAASAQTLYKLIDKNGKVTYSETPPKDFDGQVIRMDIDPNANRATLPKLPPEQLRPDTGIASPAVRDARGNLVRAQRQLDEARATPETQRLGTVGGGAREIQTEAYQQRIARLEEAVKKAEEEVRRAEGQK